MKLNIRGILKGTVFSVLLTLIMLVILSAVSYFVDLNDSIITVVLFTGVILGVFAGAFMVGRGASELKAANGLFVGIAYLVLLLIFSLVITHGIHLNMHFLTLLAGCLFASLAGGVLSAREDG